MELRQAGGRPGGRRGPGASPAVTVPPDAVPADGGDPPSGGHPGAGFLAVCLAYCAIILDGSVLNVAIPTIRHDLGSSMAGAQWVLDGYTLPLAALLLTAGALGDRIGLRRMLLGGIAVFTAASAACASAPGTGWLIGARAVQGAGAAALLPATLALVPHLFAARADRERATVAWVAAGAVSVAAGPLVGGLLIDAFGWRSIFLINLPVGVVSAWLARAHIVRETPRHRAPLDHAGQAAAAAALGLLTAGLITGGAAGWGSPATLGMLAAGAAAGAGFWLAERHGRHPMLPLAFLRHRVRTAAVISAGLMGFAFYGTLFVMSLYFQQLRGGSPGAAGIALLPLTASSTIGPLILYRPLSRRYGHAMMLAAGFACCSLGIATLAAVGARTAYPVAMAGLLLVGGASTIAFSALTSLLMSATPARQSGLGSGLQNTTRQAGALIAVSILGSVLNTGLPAGLPAGRLPVAFAILGVAVIAGIALGLTTVRAQPAGLRSRCDALHDRFPSMTGSRALPVIDVAPLVAGPGTSHASAVAERIQAACRDHGFFYVTGHAVPPELLAQLADASAEFFALPVAAKMEIAMERGGRAWRGYFPVGGELTSGRPDLKEGLYFGAELPGDDPRMLAGLPLHGRNLFPRQVPRLRELVLSYLDALTSLGQSVLAGVALSLGLDAGYFAGSYTADPTILFRIFSYPASPPDASGWGVGEHTDYGLLTLLAQDDSGGLQIAAPEGWIDAPPVPGTFVCNIGDMLDRLTGGWYRSTPHRVRNLSGHARLSFPFFLDPGFGAEVPPLPGRAATGDDGRPRWDGQDLRAFTGTYGDYLLGKVSKVFPQLREDVLLSTGPVGNGVRNAGLGCGLGWG